MCFLSNALRVQRPVFLYTGRGVDPTLSQTLYEKLGPLAIRIYRIPCATQMPKLNAAENGVLAIGGGNGIEIALGLKSQMDKIRGLVFGGWGYLGICAGATVACRDVRFPQLAVDRDAYEPTTFSAWKCPTLHLASNVDSDHMTFETNAPRWTAVATMSGVKRVYFHAGLHFAMPIHSTMDVIAKYCEAGDKPAAIRGLYGKGEVTLFGFHPEVDKNLSQPHCGLMEKWYLYIIKAANGKLYTGITTDIERRLKEHRTKKGASFFHFSAPTSVVYQECFPDRSSALRRESEIKKMPRAQKLALIDAKTQRELDYL